jgi:hypothetical protein
MVRKGVFLFILLLFVLSSLVWGSDREFKTTQKVGKVPTSQFSKLGKISSLPQELNQTTRVPLTTAAGICELSNDNATAASYYSGWSANTGTVSYFNPKNCGGASQYPFRVLGAAFTLYNWGSAVFPVQVKVVVWDTKGDSCQGVGTELYSQNYTITSAQGNFPNWAEVYFSDTICVTKPFYLGVIYTGGTSSPYPSFVSSNSTSDPASSCVNWLYDNGSLYEWYDAWADPVPGNPLIHALGNIQEPSCGGSSPCVTLSYYQDPYYFWTIPDEYGDNFLNERFTSPVDGQLKEARIAFYQSSSLGAPSAKLYIWNSNGTFPTTLIDSVVIPYANIKWFPDWNIVDLTAKSILITKNINFHIGYTVVGGLGDTIAVVSDSGGNSSNRSSEFSAGSWNTMQNDWGVGLDFLMDAVICTTSISSDFVLFTDVNTKEIFPNDSCFFNLTVTSIKGFTSPVTLSLSGLPFGTTYQFRPATVNPTGTSVLVIKTSNSVPLGTFSLTIQGNGGGKMHEKNVTLQVASYHPPYMESLVNAVFCKIRTTNYGALANDSSAENFVWNGQNYLFDGSLILGKSQNLLALDLYLTDNHKGLVPQDSLFLYSDYAGQHAKTSFIDTIGLGLKVEQFVTGSNNPSYGDFILEEFVITNTGSSTISNLYISLLLDWDIPGGGTGLANNFARYDSKHNTCWQSSVDDSSKIFGAVRIPTDDNPLYGFQAVSNRYFVYPQNGFLHNQLWNLISTPGFQIDSTNMDLSSLVNIGKINLAPGESHLESFLIFGHYPLAEDWNHWLKRMLEFAGYYRGDVNHDNIIDIQDITYLINNVFYKGPSISPFADQGDLNYDGVTDIGDITYMISQVFYAGTPVFDRERFLPFEYFNKFYRPSLTGKSNWIF